MQSQSDAEVASSLTRAEWDLLVRRLSPVVIAATSAGAHRDAAARFLHDMSTAFGG